MVNMTVIEVVIVIAGTVEDFTASQQGAFVARQRKVLCPGEANGQRCPGVSIALAVEPASVCVTSVIRYREDDGSVSDPAAVQARAEAMSTTTIDQLTIDLGQTVEVVATVAVTKNVPVQVEISALASPSPPASLSSSPPTPPPTTITELEAAVETGSDAPIGAIAGGAAAAVFVLAGLLWLYIRRRKKATPPLSVKAGSVDIDKSEDLEVASDEAKSASAPETPSAPGAKPAKPAPEMSSATTADGLSSSLSASLPSGELASTSSLPLARLVRDAQKMRRAGELLESWKIPVQELQYGENIGRGGQADVFAGRWQGLPVAIKKQRDGGRQMSEAALRSITQTVRREVRALARVRNPNVIRLYGACMEPQPCLVMAFASGGSLDQAVRQGRFSSSVPETVKLLAGIARGMEAVHAHKVIHLDLKPENVLLDAAGTPWVTDFGLSTSDTLASMSTSSAGGRGTLYYKAPELFAYPPVISATADVYAYAILSWVVCTGEQPYRKLQSAETAMPAMLAQGIRPELPDGDWRNSTTAALAELIEACWAQAYGTRPTFGGLQGVVAGLDSQEAQLLKKDEDATVETMLSRAWAAEAEKAATVALLVEYDAACAAAEGQEKVELVDERGGLEVTRAAAEASSAAAQAILKDGGHGEVLAQMMAMLQSVMVAVDEVKKDASSSRSRRPTPCLARSPWTSSTARASSS